MVAHKHKKITILFAGGGSGGHLMPGLSVAQELRNRFGDSCRIVFVGGSKALEPRLVSQYGFEFKALPSMKLPSTPLGGPAWVGRCAGGLIGAMSLLGRLKPDLVVALGGYAALAPALAAAVRDIPLVVMEQNAIPGKVSKLLSSWAREIYVPWPNMDAAFKRPERVHVTGNPIRQNLLISRSSKCAAAFGLSPRKRTLLVMGGSQGARFINQTIIAALPLLEAESEWLQVLHAAGEKDHHEVSAAYSKARIQAAAFPFIEDMASAYGACDLALCRAGGTTLAELTAVGIPSVLVPLPSAANDHQRRNASRVACDGAAFIVEQNDLQPDQLAGVILRLMHNEACLARARAACLRLGRPAAAKTVADRIVSFIPGLAAFERATSVAAVSGV